MKDVILEVRDYVVLDQIFRLQKYSFWTGMKCKITARFEFVLGFQYMY